MKILKGCYFDPDQQPTTPDPCQPVCKKCDGTGQWPQPYRHPLTGLTHVRLGECPCSQKVPMKTLKWTSFDPPRTRTYVYPGGERITFPNVTRIAITGYGHRLEMGDLPKVYVKRGWLYFEFSAPDWKM